MVRFDRMRRAAALAMAGCAALLLAACTDYGELPKHLRPLASGTKHLLEQKGMAETSPILVRIFKEESKMEVWKKQKATGRFALLKTYDICKWSGGLGPKKAEGDRQAPEGFYTITPAQMNPGSNYFLSFNIGYPNEYDRSLGRTGSSIMVHGACSSRGCYSMDDKQIQEIYTLARLAFQGGQRNFQVQAYPFHMTPANMAKHRHDDNIAFWRMLKVGYDNFEVTGQEPKVDVCSQRYVFNSVPQNGVTVSPTGACPPMSVPDPIRVAVAEKETKDEAETLVLASKLDVEDAREKERMDRAATAAMVANALPSTAAPMSVASAPVSLTTGASATVASGDAGKGTPGKPAKPLVAPIPAAAPTEVARTEATPPASANEPEMAAAYAPSSEPEPRGFFARVLKTVNPF